MTPRDEYVLRDAGVLIPPRTLAHSLSDEAYEPYHFEPYRTSLREYVGIAFSSLVGVVIVGGLLVALLLQAVPV
jgi:hypothetical protein